jgi:hypothetical protein
MISGRTPPFTAIAKVFNVLGLVYVTLPVRIALAGFLALRRRWWHLAAFTAAIVLSEVLIGSLKGSYDRTRPHGRHARLAFSRPAAPGAAGERHAFKLPPASKLLLILAVVAALAGIVLATRRGRRFAMTRLMPGLRSAAASLRTVAASPVKLTLLAGGSALITLAYIGGLAASVQAFGGHAGITEIGAVYLGAAVIAAASPTPGGLGAIEAALVAGLTGIGVPPRARGLGGPHLPAGHLPAARHPRLGRLAAPAKTRLRMTPWARVRGRVVWRRATATTNGQQVSIDTDRRSARPRSLPPWVSMTSQPSRTRNTAVTTAQP